MEVAAKYKGARLSAQKARLVADQVRGKAVEDALNIFDFSALRKQLGLSRKLLSPQLLTLSIRRPGRR